MAACQNTSDFEIAQKFKEEISSMGSKTHSKVSISDSSAHPAELQQAPPSDQPSLKGFPGNLPAKIGFFQKLYSEQLRRPDPRCGSPMTRQEFLERQELKECVFKPKLSLKTEVLAESRRNRSQHSRVEDALMDDATRRVIYKRQLEENVCDSTECAG